jgi:hypothetical protein|tara:strand:- start:450 stop:824 length:375 start_codon:yes stop_codon:yes gene_type:complete
MIQEVNPPPRIMAINLAEPLLGGLYTLFADALGSTVAWWVGHITLVAGIALLYWTITNWEELSYGLGLNGTRLVAYLVLIGATVGQMMVYQEYFAFPTSGAFITAGATSAYIWWQWYQLEPQKV